MRVLTRHALTYFASLGLILLVAGGFLVLSALAVFNATRVVDLLLVVLSSTLLFLGQTFLISGVVAYVMSRRGYSPPRLGEVPRAEVVALIPAYNEEENIGDVVRRARRYVDLVIVVDDGSRDRTAERAAEAGAFVIRHHVNMGYGAAVKTLIKAAIAADARFAVQLDADGQHNPDEIPRFLEALRGGADFVVGDRFGVSKVPFYRRVGISVIRLGLRLMGVKIRDPENGFRGYSRRALEYLDKNLEETWMGISAQAVYMATRGGLKVATVPTVVTYGGDTSSEFPLKHGLSIVWTLVWTWLASNPKKALALGLGGMSISILLLLYVVYLFNITRYIRLTFTTVALILEVVSVVIIATSIALIINRRR